MEGRLRCEGLRPCLSFLFKPPMDKGLVLKKKKAASIYTILQSVD